MVEIEEKRKYVRRKLSFIFRVCIGLVGSCWSESDPIRCYLPDFATLNPRARATDRVQGPHLPPVLTGASLVAVGIENKIRTWRMKYERVLYTVHTYISWTVRARTVYYTKKNFCRIFVTLRAAQLSNWAKKKTIFERSKCVIPIVWETLFARKYSSSYVTWYMRYVMFGALVWCDIRAYCGCCVTNDFQNTSSLGDTSSIIT